MKSILLFIFSGFHLLAPAQSQQVKSYLQQIAGNKIHIQYLQQAIRIARTGLNTIGDIRKGEFQLHQTFIKGLQVVNPKIRNWSRVTAIVSFQKSILTSCRSSLTRLKESGQFSGPEMEYVLRVFSKVLDDSNDMIQLLSDLITDSRLTMSDDERIKRIDRIYASMQSNYRFVQKFTRDTILLALQRNQEILEVNTSKQLFNLH